MTPRAPDFEAKARELLDAINDGPNDRLGRIAAALAAQHDAALERAAHEAREHGDGLSGEELAEAILDLGSKKDVMICGPYCPGHPPESSPSEPPPEPEEEEGTDMRDAGEGAPREVLEAEDPAPPAAETGKAPLSAITYVNAEQWAAAGQPPLDHDDKKPREPGCQCHQEEGDSACAVHDPPAPERRVSAEEPHTEMNLNDSVWVRVTALGEGVYKQHWRKLGIDPSPPLERDAKGWTKFQLWELAHIFGSALWNGGEMPVETTIRLAAPAPDAALRARAEAADFATASLEDPKVAAAAYVEAMDQWVKAEARAEAAEKERDALRAEKNGAYAERNQCVALLVRMALALGWRAGVRDHEDKPGETWEPDWRSLVCIDLPTGQVSWHFHDSEKHLLAGLPEYTGSWDGHDTSEKYRRVNAALASPAPQAADPRDAREDELRSRLFHLAAGFRQGGFTAQAEILEGTIRGADLGKPIVALLAEERDAAERKLRQTVETIRTLDLDHLGAFYGSAECVRRAILDRLEQGESWRHPCACEKHAALRSPEPAK